MSIRRASDITPLTDAAGSDQQPELDPSWTDGYRAGFAAGSEVGAGQAILEVKAVQHGIVDQLAGAAALERSRWTVRGQERTRATFGAPHPDDFPGRGDAA